MDAGKTTTVAFLARGLLRAGLRVGYVKITGTGAGGDLWMVGDAGAAPVLDFTDAGLASTYRYDTWQVERVALDLLAHLDAAAVDVALVEVADGPYQPETAALLESGFLAKNVDGVLFAAADAMGTAAGSQLLKQAGLRVLGVTGLFTASPLQQREAMAAARLPIFGRLQLADPATARKLLDEARG
jgi:ABC-type sugar transport system substrate-binding protein